MDSVIEIGEFQTLDLADLSLAPDELQSLTSSSAGARHFNLEFHRDGIHLRPRGFIGVLPLTSAISVSIRSQLAPRNLLRILTRSGRWPHLVDRSFRTVAAVDLDAGRIIRLLADALVVGIDEILELGWFHEYVSVKEASAFPRGRILWNETMQYWARGLRHQAVYRTAERSADNTVNQAVRLALEQILARLHSLPIGGDGGDVQDVIAALETRRLLMQHVSIVTRSSLLDEPMLTGRVPLPPSRGHYEPVIRISLEILGATRASFGAPGSDFPMPHFAVEMRTAFESYVRDLVRQASGVLSTQVLVENGMFSPPRGARRRLFSDDSNYEVAPDIVARTRDGNIINLIAEVKYVLQEDRLERRYIERLLTYALAYRCKTVLLVHPVSTSGAQGLIDVGRLAGVRICRYGFHLFADSLESAEEEFVTAVAGLLDMVPPMPEALHWGLARS